MGTGGTPALEPPSRSDWNLSILDSLTWSAFLRGGLRRNNFFKQCGLHVGCRANHINKANGLISTAQLNMLPCVHLPPINLVVFQEAHGEYLSWSVLRA